MVFLIKHKRSYGPTGISMVASLAMDTDSGVANTKMIDSARDSMRRGRH